MLCVRQPVWMSHGDEAVELPDGFSVVCKSVQGAIAAIENPSIGVYGLQFHPEVCMYALHATVLMFRSIEGCKMVGRGMSRSIDR
jgi:GMP synthase (glutamine-hydrolysing)